MTINATRVKAATSILDYQEDWTLWLNGRTIATSVWSVSPVGELAIDSVANTTTTATAYVSGGIAGKSYVLTNTITTNGAPSLTASREVVIVVDPARFGMTTLLRQLRALTNAGAADYTVNGELFFSDSQLQDALDSRVAIYRDVALVPLPQRNGSAYVYKEFTIPESIPRWIEEDGAGTGGWAVRASTGIAKVIGTDYTVNYRSGVITFATDQVNALGYTLDCRSYALYTTAADIWREKAALESRSVDWGQSDAHFSASQRRDFCLTMAETMEQLAGIQFHTVLRSDER